MCLKCCVPLGTNRVAIKPKISFFNRAASTIRWHTSVGEVRRRDRDVVAHPERQHGRWHGQRARPAQRTWHSILHVIKCELHAISPRPNVRSMLGRRCIWLQHPLGVLPVDVLRRCQGIKAAHTGQDACELGCETIRGCGDTLTTEHGWETVLKVHLEKVFFIVACLLLATSGTHMWMTNDSRPAVAMSAFCIFLRFHETFATQPTVALAIPATQQVLGSGRKS